MFKNFGGLGNMAALLANAQQIPSKMKELTEQLKQEVVEASAGDGAVQVTLNGVGQMRSIEIDSAAKQDPQLEQWIAEACNAAGREAKQRYADAVTRMAGELNINVPGLDGVLANLTGGA